MKTLATTHKSTVAAAAHSVAIRRPRRSLAMIDYARPYDQNMCDFLLSPTPPAPTRLEDFQVFKKGNPNYIYGNYYNNYDMYAEPDIESTANVYHTLVTSREIRHEDWKYKAVSDWSADDTTYWLIDCAMNQGFSEYDVPFYNFKISGIDLRHMRPEEIFQRMMHPSVDTNLSRRIADIIYDKLHARINEEMLRHTPLFRYGDSDYQHHEPVQTVLDLDSLDYKNRLHASDYKPNDISLLHTADSSDDAEDAFRASETGSPEYGSEASKSGDEDKKRFKRPPGRPKGTGRKVCKRPRSVSVPEFLRNLLLDKAYCPSIIKWEDHLQGKFRFVKPDEVAKLWGHLKQNDNMTFEKFSRAMRYHYRQSVLVSVPTARLVYQFGPKGPNFKTENPNFVKVKSEVHDMSYSNS